MRAPLRELGVPAALALAVCLPASLSAQGQEQVKELDVTLKSSSEQREQGIHGQIELHGDIIENLRFANLEVVESTGSPDLDAWFIEAMDGAGLPSKSENQGFTRIVLRLSVQNIDYEDGIRIVYSCQQAVRDADWAVSNVQDWDVENEFLFAGITGLLWLALADDTEAFKNFDDEVIKRAWLAAIEECRASADTQFMDMLGTVMRNQREAAND